MTRCSWAEKNDLERDYHDREWGLPVTDDRRHFEMITLEGAQSGLSWLTILGKRDGYRRAFAGFDPLKVAKYTEFKQEQILDNAEIVRHRGKVASTVKNAKAFLAIQEEFGSFNAYIWRFVDGLPINNGWKTTAEVPATTPLSEQIGKDLKVRGFSFVGPTTVYSYLQAVGIVNDHLQDCFRYQSVLEAQAALGVVA